MIGNWDWVDGIWSGRVMYMAVNQHAIISDVSI